MGSYLHFFAMCHHFRKLFRLQILKLFQPMSVPMMSNTYLSVILKSGSHPSSCLKRFQHSLLASFQITAKIS